MAKETRVVIGGVEYVLRDDPQDKPSVARKVFQAIKGLWKSRAVWNQANQVEDVVMWKQAQAAVAAVRSWDRGKVGTGALPSSKATPGPVPNDVRRAVRARSKDKCEIRSELCTGHGYNYHHVVPRSAGGPHTLENLKHACLPCHKWVHGGEGRE